MVIKINNEEPEEPTDEADTIGTALDEIGQKILPSAVPAEYTDKVTDPTEAATVREISPVSDGVVEKINH